MSQDFNPDSPAFLEAARMAHDLAGHINVNDKDSLKRALATASHMVFRGLDNGSIALDVERTNGPAGLYTLLAIAVEIVSDGQFGKSVVKMGVH